MKKFNILQYATLLIRSCSKKTFRIIRLTTLLLSVTVFNVFGGTTDSDYTNLNLNKETDPAAIMQQNRIIGTVTDEKGNPLPGVNVVLTGTTQGSTTDIDGKYSINISNGAKSLTFSFIGMKSQEVSIGALTQINVTMIESAFGLEDVVVIGYGTIKKSDLTGAVGVIKSDVISNRKDIQISQALQGTMPGLMVTRDNTDPGSTATLRIRGITTIGDSNPLIIIDGVPGGSIDDVN